MHVVLLWRFRVAHVHEIDLRVRVPLLGGAQRWVSRPASTRPVARPHKINTLLVSCAHSLITLLCCAHVPHPSVFNMAAGLNAWT